MTASAEAQRDVRAPLAAISRWLRSRQGQVSLCLAAALLTLSGSLGVSQRAAADPASRIARVTGGDFSPRALAVLAARMGPASAELARRHVPGVGEWTPGGPLGWPAYDMESLPSLGLGEITFEQARELNALVPDSPLPNPPLAPFRLPAQGRERERALQCLTQAVYYEAGFESGEGQEAVAQVVLNRLRHPAYPKSICGVVYQGAQRASGCQFSFTCDGSLARPVAPLAWRRARYVAQQALNGFVYKPVGASTHYHADYVFPYWAVTLVKLKQIGAHIFYRMTGPGGAPEAFVGRYAGGELSLPESVLTGGDARTPDAPSVAAKAVRPEAPTRTVTLNIGDEARTYTIVDAPAPGEATPPLLDAPGALKPVRRQPTPDEIRRINERLEKFEDAQKAEAGPVAPPSAAAP